MHNEKNPEVLLRKFSIRSRLTRAFLPVMLVAIFINDILIRVLSSVVKVNPVFLRSLVAIASAAIVGVIIAKLAKSIGTPIDNFHSELIQKDDELVQNNKLLSMIAENINEGFLVLDSKLENVIYTSPGYERIGGKSKKDLLDNLRSFFDDIYPDDLKRVIDAYNIQKTDKLSVHVEFRIMLQNGSVRWIDGQGFPVKNASGQVTNHIGIVKDITDKKQAEENLRSERDFSDAALDSLPAIFSLLDTTGKYLRWNKNFEMITGYSAEEIKKLHPSDLIDDYSISVITEKMQNISNIDGIDLETYLVCKNGEKIPYYFTAHPININEVKYVIGIGIDIALRKQTESALVYEKETVQKYLNIAGVLIVAINTDMELILINKKACEVFGYEEKELIGKDINDICTPEDIQSEAKIFTKKILSNEITDTERMNFHSIVLTKKGEKRTIEWNAELLKDDTGKITGMLSSGEDVTERIKMQDMLIQAKNEWEETFNTINDAITIHDGKHNIIRANKTAKELLGIFLEDMNELKCYQLYHGSESPPSDCPCHIALKSGEVSVRKMFEPHLDRHFEIKAIPRYGKDKQAVGIVHIVKDISDQVKAEEGQRVLQSQFLHMQKMESIGRLAGGVAHDFNNILSGIIGFSELMLLDISKDDPLKERIELILGLGEKAVSLTQQLLAFSRKQMLIIKDININNVVTDMARMLKRIIGEDIKLELKHSKTIRNALCDQGQMEQVLLNLAVNSRDAMPNGGVLTIETAEIVLNEDNIKKLEDVKPGEYVKLTISDTGCGMSSSVLENIFEPFYTTKELGKGTGLGLATVYGIIKQHNGYIDVTSKLNEGSVFNLYLPVSNHKEIENVSESDPLQISGGDETILVVDDEPILLSIIEKALNPLGYQLLVAVSTQEAIKISETYEGTIDLLLTDVIMPKMNGNKLADMIVSARPGIKVVFMSGYPSESITDHGSDKETGIYLQKPLRVSTIRQKLREILDDKTI